MNDPQLASGDFAFYAVAIALFLLISAFFSASETALTAFSRARMHQLAKDGSKRAMKVLRLREQKDTMIGSVLIGNNVVNIGASAIATGLAINVLGNDAESLAIATLAMSVLIIIFSEILPKTIAIHHAERVSLIVAGPLSLLVKLLSPATRCLQLLLQPVLKLLKSESGGAAFVSATDVLRGAIDLHHQDGYVVKQDRDMLGSILDLSEREVGEVMVHRKHITTLDADLPAWKLVEQAFASQHTRLPLWKDDPDNIIGILHVKDLIHTLSTNRGVIDERMIIAIAHKPWFVPETTSLQDQLLAFRARQQHIAMVVNEYGALLGIVTLEDIIEEIVGQINDEHDERERGHIQQASDNTYYVAGEVTVRDLNRELDWNLPNEHAATIAGLVMHIAREIPLKGRHIDFDDYRFTVVDRTHAAIRRLKIERHAPTEPGEKVPVS